MVFSSLYFFLTLITLLIATYTDLRKRIVPNRLTYTIAGTGIILKIFESLNAQAIEPILFAFAAATIAFVVSYALYRMGAWAGGDVKLVTALAIINPVNYGILRDALGLQGQLLSTTPLPIFAVTLIVASIFSMLPLGILMALTASLKHKEVFARTMKAVASKATGILGAGIFAAGVETILSKSGIELFWVLPIMVAAAFIPKKARNAAIIISAVAGLLVSAQNLLFNSIAIAVPLVCVYFLWKLYAESREFAFREKIETAKITEGMIPDYYLVEKGGKIIPVEAPSIKSVIKQLMDNKIENALKAYKVPGNVFSSPREAGGLTEEAAKELRKKALQGNAPKQLVVRKTAAFVPAILIAYIALQFTGDLIWNLII
ncbi:MAG: A24 family peptidase [archaeon]